MFDPGIYIKEEQIPAIKRERVNRSLLFSPADIEKRNKDEDYTSRGIMALADTGHMLEKVSVGVLCRASSANTVPKASQFIYPPSTRNPFNAASLIVNPGFEVSHSSLVPLCCELLIQNYFNFKCRFRLKHSVSYENGLYFNYSEEVAYLLKLGVVERRSMIEMQVIGFNCLFDLYHMLEIDLKSRHQYCISWIDVDSYVNGRYLMCVEAGVLLGYATTLAVTKLLPKPFGRESADVKVNESNTFQHRLRKDYGIKGEISVVFLLEKSKAKLLPLKIPNEEEENPSDYQIVPGFQVRIISVPGTIPVGQILASYVVTQWAELQVLVELVADFDSDYYRILHQHLIEHEELQYGIKKEVQVDIKEVIYIVKELWQREVHRGIQILCRIFNAKSIFLGEEGGGSVSKCISARIEIDNCMRDDMIGSYAETPVSGEHISMSDAFNIRLSMKPIVITCPHVSEECNGERKSSKLMKNLNCVCLVHGKEPPKSILEVSGKWTRKASYGHFINTSVYGSTFVYQLKIKSRKFFTVVKEKQMLHNSSKIIDKEIACLADLNILSGDIMWMTDSKIHENLDIANELLDPNLDMQKGEEGFCGILLILAISSQAIYDACCSGPVIQNLGETDFKIVEDLVFQIQGGGMTYVDVISAIFEIYGIEVFMSNAGDGVALQASLIHIESINQLYMSRGDTTLSRGNIVMHRAIVGFKVLGSLVHLILDL